ncbi:MAG: Uma2 family endonuclease [Blastocatellia bacterium]
MATQTRATIEDLHEVKGKAEIVDGEIVPLPPTGDDPIQAGFEIAVSLRQHARQTRSGIAVPDNAAFHVNLPDRETFSPDAAFYTGPRTGMEYYEGAPVFAVEVRSKNDYGPKAEREIAQKRADYFMTGTQVIWDVDLLSDEVIKSYSAADPEHPRIFRRGEIADAEPAVPGWRIPVDDLFS